MPIKGDPRVLRMVTGGILGAWTNVGGATAAASVSDDIDTTYALAPGRDLPDQGSYIRFLIADTTLASNERCVQARLRIKAKVNDSGGSTRRTVLYFQLRAGNTANAHPATVINYVPTITPAKEYFGKWFTRDPRGLEWTTLPIRAAMAFLIDYTPASFTSGQRIRVTEVYFDYIVNRRPVLTSPTVTETTTTTSPLVSYTWTDADGDIQSAQQVKVFTQAQTTTAGFNPDVTTPVYDSTRVGTINNEHRIAANLTNGVTYVAYVRAAQVLGDLGEWWSAWVNTSFTISLTPPLSPELALIGYEAAFDRVTLQLRGRLNILTDQDASLEATGVGTWVNSTNATLARTVAQADVGAASLQMTSVAAGNMEARTGPYIVVPNRPYMIRARVRSAAVSRQARVRVEWFSDAAGTASISTSSATLVSTSTSAWTGTLSAGIVSPSNARSAKLKIEFQSTAGAGEVHYTDGHFLGPGTSFANVFYMAGDLVDDTQYEIQYADMPRRGNLVHPNISSGGGYFENIDGWYPRTGTDEISVSNQVPPWRGDWCIRWVPDTTGSVLDVGSRQNIVDPYIWAVVPGGFYEHSVRLRTFTGSLTVNVRFVYRNADGVEVAASQSGNVSISNAWTEVAPPDSTAINNPVFMTMEIQNQSGTTDVPLFIDDVQVGEFPYRTDVGDPGQASALVWRPWRRSMDLAAGDLSAVNLITDLVADQEASLYDHEVPPDKVRLFRARAVSIISEQEVASAWSTILPVSQDITGNWLKYPWEPSINFQPQINGMRPMRRRRGQNKGVHRIIGRKTPAVIASEPTSESFVLELVVQTVSDWHRLEEMLLSDGPFLLKTPQRQWWVQFVGEPEEFDYTARVRAGDSYYRSVSVEMIEVATP